MANTHRGWFSIPLYAGSIVSFDDVASMIAAGSALGGAFDVSAASDGTVASVTFPRAASLNQAVPASPGAPMYPWDGMIFRLVGPGSCMWTTDRVGTPAGSIGISMLGNDPKAVSFPGSVRHFKVFANGAGTLTALFLQGDNIGL
jgi:hypothetical protein